MNVFFKGTTYILVIDTDSYSGNFERQICAYTTGIFDEDRFFGGKESQDALNENKTLVEGLIAKQRIVLHEEYDWVTNTIRETPGRSNTGYGGHYDAKPDEKGYPVYESVAIFFEEPLSEEEILFVKERANKFATLNSIKILDIYMVKSTITSVEERI